MLVMLFSTNVFIRTSYAIRFLTNIIKKSCLGWIDVPFNTFANWLYIWSHSYNNIVFLKENTVRNADFIRTMSRLENKIDDLKKG